MYDDAAAPERANGLRAFEALAAFLEADGWHPQRLDDKYIYRVGFMGKNGQFTCYAQVRPDLEQFLFYAMAPVKAPEADRPAVAEFITRANYGLRIGNFELDFRDGEVRYKSSLDFEGETLSHAWLEHAIYPAVQTMDRYLPGLMNVLYGGVPPDKAVTEIEGT
jgi:hypothetical protein